MVKELLIAFAAASPVTACTKPGGGGGRVPSHRSEALRRYRSLLLATLLTTTVAFPATAADDGALYSKKVITRARTHGDCLQNARHTSLIHVRLHADEVTGTSFDGKVHVVITCVGPAVPWFPGDKAMAIVVGGITECRLPVDPLWVRRVVDATAEEVRTAPNPD